MRAPSPIANWHRAAEPADVVRMVLALFDRHGSRRYDEAVSQTHHAVQAADLVRAAGGAPELVVAALLHDVGHLLEPEDLDAIRARDLHHELTGSRLLERYFAAEVTEPIRLHVAAKRFLCATEADYRAGLSPASVTSLELQGGPMSPQEVRRFADQPGCAAAVLVRRCDDLAKDPVAVVPPLERYAELLTTLVSTRR